ncbi:hypothetical protein [Aquitalea aquatilis]|uniref:hypothetical protein n=1 Tax=Aquitalea aquatilis TaxID=1537400 RepID=UPI0010BD2DBF|nr:hypothetical protein [Aquitalea aquatilis]
MKHFDTARRFGSRIALAASAALASGLAMADAPTLPDLTTQVTAMGTQVTTQASSQAGAAAPYALYVAGALMIFGLAKKFFKKIG